MRQRRGNQAIEFALLLPVLLFLISGIVDLGHYMFVSDGLVHAVAQGGRLGALADPDDGEDPVATANSVTTASWTASELPGTISVSSAVVNVNPDAMIVVRGSVPYTAFFGFLGLPATVRYQATVRLMYLNRRLRRRHRESMESQTRSFLFASFFGFASVLVAGVAAFGVFVVLGNYQEALREATGVEPEDIIVLTAAKDLAMGHTIVAADLVETELRSAYVAPTSMRRAEDIIGRVAGERILAGDLIRQERLAPAEAGHDLDAVIATGMRARSVNLSGASQISGFLLPGNRVDVIITLYDRATGQVAETTTLVQAVRVLAVDERTEEAGERGIRLKPQVTLEVAPADAERITHAQQNGDIRLTLRSDIDFVYEETRGATTQALLGGTPGAERRTITELREAVGDETSLSVVRIIRGGETEVERLP